MYKPTYTPLLAAFVCLFPASALAILPESHQEVDGRPSSWDADLSSPFSIAEDFFGFPNNVPILGVSTFHFAIPGVSNTTSSPIAAQIYVANGFILAPDGVHHLLATVANSIASIPLTGCIVTIPPDSANQPQGPTNVSQTCAVTASDNATLLSLGILSNLSTTQSLHFGFGPEARGLTFPPVAQNSNVTVTLTPSWTPVTFVSSAGSVPAPQSLTLSGFVSEVPCANPPQQQASWLPRVQIQSTGNNLLKLTLAPNPSGLSAGIYSTVVCVNPGSVNLPVNLNILPATTQFVQQGSKLVSDPNDTPDQGGMGLGASVSLSQDGNTALAGAPFGVSQGTDGAAWLYTRLSGQWSTSPSAETFVPIGQSAQGTSVGMSGDGSVLLSGGPNDHNSLGAAWVTGGPCTPAKLVGSGAAGAAGEGGAVALSSDGLTAIVGGSGDNSNVGAAWILTCSGGTWVQQHGKLTANDSTGTAFFGDAVALSADGNTALIGGSGDNSNTGAAWVFARSGGVWAQQGHKLLGNDLSGVASFGISVALSADGNTALIGGRRDANFLGAAWVFIRSGTSWNQQGPKLVGTNSVGPYIYEGGSVSLSADGNTAASGAMGDNNFTGAAWVFRRSNGQWTQFGSKLTGNDSVPPSQPSAIALSGDGNTMLLGGFVDNAGVGAAWPFVISGPAPNITSISPSNAALGSAGFTLTVNGANFLNGATVQWDGIALPTTFGSSSQLTATVAASLLTLGGSIPVSVINPEGTPTGAATFTIKAPILSVVASHSGYFALGDSGVYLVTVSNAIGALSTSGTVVAADIVPAGVSLLSMSGSGWTCPAGGNACTRSDVLGPGASYPSIAVVVSIDPAAVTPLANQATVSGGQSASASAFDNTDILAISPCDVNSDSTINTSDILQILRQSLGVNARASDLNSDGRVNVIDTQMVVNAVLNRGCTAH